VLGGRSLARRHSQVVKRATRDSLTNLANHRSFQDELARAIADAARNGAPLAVALIDLDDFKFTNDRYGHRRGDEMLIEFARVLERGRATDRAFRIGGDEFALLLPGAEATDARVSLEQRLAAARGGAATASFTAGVAVLPAGTETDPAVLWEQADAASPRLLGYAVSDSASPSTTSVPVTPASGCCASCPSNSSRSTAR
jgi:diguanylate cyclase (GGDEF)-like protein